MTGTDTMTSDLHARLLASYRAVGDRTWTASDFLEPNLESSRALYTPESLVARRPRPKTLEVYALLSGLPFSDDFVRPLVDVQQRISGILGDGLHYWVGPDNLGLEYIVFKWPADPWAADRLSAIEAVLASIRQPAFQFDIRGVQVNPDGCVVARGFDEGGVLFRIREQLRSDLPGLPERQSAWAHVPMGRILEPVGTRRFSQLRSLFDELADVPIAATRIDALQLIHETRWYMEARTTLATYPLLTT